MAEATTLESFDILRLMQLLPHRYPFLLVDRIIDIDGDNSAVGIKNVTVNEPHFTGHFPGQPVMPGVLIVEAMAQTAGAICIHEHSPKDGANLIFFMTIDNAKFRRPVVPGNRVHIPVRQIKRRGFIFKFACEALVDGVKVAEADLGAMLGSGQGE